MLPSQEHTLKCCVLSRKGGDGDVTLGLGYTPKWKQGESCRTEFEPDYDRIQSLFRLYAYIGGVRTGLWSDLECHSKVILPR